MSKPIKRRSVLAAIPALLALPAFAQPAPAYPSRVVRIVVPFTAGSATDLSARLIAQELTTRLQQQFIVDNKPGASGLVGLDAVAKAPPDGYTLVLSGPGLATFHLLFKKLQFDPAKDFAFISRLYDDIGGVLINGSLPVNNLAEFAAYARANPGKMNYGSLGKNTTMLMGESLKHYGKFPMQEIAYPGTPPALLALLRNEVQLSFVGIEPQMADIRAGKLKVLAVTNSKRVPAFPDIPTVAEAYPGFQAATWGGLLAPAGTPPAIVNRLSSEIASIMSSPDVKEALAKQSKVPVGSTPEEFKREFEANMKAWAEVARVAGVKPE